MFEIPKDKETEEEPPIFETIKHYLHNTITICKQESLVITGNVVFETGKEIVMLNFKGCANGDWVAWFPYGENIHLLALVNEKMKHFLKVHHTKIDELRATLQEILPEIGK